MATMNSKYAHFLSEPFCIRFRKTANQNSCLIFTVFWLDYLESAVVIVMSKLESNMADMTLYIAYRVCQIEILKLLNQMKTLKMFHLKQNLCKIYQRHSPLAWTLERYVKWCYRLGHCDDPKGAFNGRKSLKRNWSCKRSLTLTL